VADEPISEKPYAPAYVTPAHGTLPWSWAVERLTQAHDYWLATVRPDGRPHLMPVWCVWQDKALYFSTDPTSRKAQNFSRDSRIAVSTDGAGATAIVEGSVAVVEDYDTRVRVAAAYAAKYDWPLTATDKGVAFDDVETPLYVVKPDVAFGVTDEAEPRMTRWRF
jgi:PPOX class probable F420-dependent enzyme